MGFRLGTSNDCYLVLTHISLISPISLKNHSYHYLFCLLLPALWEFNCCIDRFNPEVLSSSLA